ncbi:PhzF family isomerase [Pseudomonas sp. CGJS7]|uniref:PhzF family isomerase n=1 Tax=Pseudomonas sp. CGJS7 TaxID=3109348 RepID=UPI003008CA95
MSRSYRIYQVDAFTREAFTGNPAGVVLDADGLSDAQMQAIAREFNNSETAFVLSPRDDSHALWLRYFTPTTEVPVCGHATVAAHYARAVELGLPATSLRQLTGVGVMQIDIEPDGAGDYRVWMRQNPPQFGPALSDSECAALVAALGIDADELGDGPVEIVSTGHSKVMVPLRRRERMDRLAPDLPALAALSRRIGCNGFHVFALDAPAPGVLAHGRMFAPAIGIAEDPVTGNANGPLGAYLVRHRLIDPARYRDGLSAVMGQGEAIGRPGRVRVEVAVEGADAQPVSVRIGGDATIVFAATIRV